MKGEWIICVTLKESNVKAMARTNDTINPIRLINAIGEIESNVNNQWNRNQVSYWIDTVLNAYRENQVICSIANAINERNSKLKRLNKADKFVKRLIDNAPFHVNSDFDMHYYVYRQCSIHLQLESGYADIPDKHMPIEYENAINQFSPLTIGKD